MQVLLLIYIFIVSLPGFSPEQFIFPSCFDMTVQASFSSPAEAAPLEICHTVKDIYFSRESSKCLRWHFICSQKEKCQVLLTETSC